MVATTAAIDDVLQFRERLVRGGVIALYFGVVLLSAGNPAPGLLGGEAGDFLLQGIIEVLWLAIVVLVVPGLRTLRFELDDGLLMIGGLVFWAALSSLWAGSAGNSAMKAVALVFNVCAVFLTVARLGAATMIETAIAGLFLTSVASIVLVVVAPDIAILKTWQHTGQWSGVFDSKQTLGINSAILLFLSALRFFAHRAVGWRLYHAAVMVAATICLLGAGSRGGLVLAGGAVTLTLIARWNRQAEVAMAWLPVVAMVVAAAFQFTLWATDLDYLPIGEGIDFTERTKIWKHALDYLTPGIVLFGAGLNGFWSRKDVEDMFRGAHDWFLDNFHCGFLGILAETGLIGSVMFVVLTGLIVASALRQRREAAERERNHHSLAYGFMALFYLINMTETYFLKSTNFLSMLFFTITFFLFGRPRMGTDAATR